MAHGTKISAIGKNRLEDSNCVRKSMLKNALDFMLKGVDDDKKSA